MSGDLRNVQHPPRLQAGKAATKALIRAYGGQEAAAGETGKSQSRLAAYGLPNTPDFAPIDVIVALEGATHGAPGHPHVTRWLAREAGYALVRLPARLPAHGDFHAALAAVSKETSDVVQAVCAGLADQRLDAAEAARLRAEIVHAQERLAELDALAAMVGES